MKQLNQDQNKKNKVFPQNVEIYNTKLKFSEEINCSIVANERVRVHGSNDIEFYFLLSAQCFYVYICFSLVLFISRESERLYAIHIHTYKQYYIHMYADSYTLCYFKSLNNKTGHSLCCIKVTHSVHTL